MRGDIRPRPGFCQWHLLLHLTVPGGVHKEAPCDGPVAQLVEQLTFNQWVTGSNPVGLTTTHPSIADAECIPPDIIGALGPGAGDS